MFYLDNVIIFRVIQMIRIQMVSKFYTIISWGCLVGHPYIASLWLGFLFARRSRLKGFCVIAWLCSVCCQATFKLFGFSVNKGFKGSFCYFMCPFLCFLWGQCYTRDFVLYIMDPIQIIINIHLLSADISLAVIHGVCL